MVAVALDNFPRVCILDALFRLLLEWVDCSGWTAACRWIPSSSTTAVHQAVAAQLVVLHGDSVLPAPGWARLNIPHTSSTSGQERTETQCTSPAHLRRVPVLLPPSSISHSVPGGALMLPFPRLPLVQHSIQAHDLASVGGEVRLRHPRSGLAPQLICQSANPLPLFPSCSSSLQPSSPSTDQLLFLCHRPTPSLLPQSSHSIFPPAPIIYQSIHSSSIHTPFRPPTSLLLALCLFASRPSRRPPL